jgi:hypothetical protein
LQLAGLCFHPGNPTLAGATMLSFGLTVFHATSSMEGD